MIVFVSITLLSVLLVVYTAICNYYLIKRYDKAIFERDEALSDFNKLKLLNKLKVDWDSKPIVYKGED